MKIGIYGYGQLYESILNALGANSAEYTVLAPDREEGQIRPHAFDLAILCCHRQETYSLARKLVSAGIPVAFAADIGDSSGEYEELDRLCKENGVFVVPLDYDICFGNIVNARQLLESGKIGRPASFDFLRFVPIDEEIEISPESLQSNNILIANYLFGKPLSSRVFRRSLEGVTSLCNIIRYESGVVANVGLVFGCTYEEFYTKYEISGSGGVIAYDSKQADSSSLCRPGKRLSACDRALDTSRRNPYAAAVDKLLQDAQQKGFSREYAERRRMVTEIWIGTRAEARREV